MASPCIDVCRFDEATGWCLGCGMAKPEKKRWKKERETRPAIRASLPARLAALGQAGHATGTAAKRKRKG
jgi:uncharacterized protein